MRRSMSQASLPKRSRRPARARCGRWRPNVPGAEFDVEFRSGERTRCVIREGALGRLDELSAEVGLSGTGALLVDERLLSTRHQEALVPYAESRLGAPIA